MQKLAIATALGVDYPIFFFADIMSMCHHETYWKSALDVGQHNIIVYYICTWKKYGTSGNFLIGK